MVDLKFVKISIVDDKVKIFDSDNELIDYFTIENDGNYVNEFYKKLIKKKADNEVAKLLADTFTVVKDFVVNPTFDEITILQKKYGKDFINRVGNCYLIIKE